VIPYYLAPLAQPLAANRREPPVFLSLLLSAGHQMLVVQLSVGHC
jgi:hypothetical protein